MYDIIETVCIPQINRVHGNHSMNGAGGLVRSLIASANKVCFANPGVSEMHFVAARDRVEGRRCILGLFEGEVTGAAYAYVRVTEKPPIALLHLYPGLGVSGSCSVELPMQ
jgi:thiamine pyrophosphate-dependent acetolactate synthase large subunit-like protein